MTSHNPDMKLFMLGGMEFLCDPEATERAYEQIASEASEECECDACRNYAAVRHQAYSEDLLLLLRRLGVDPDYEAETSWLCRMAPRGHLYSGWFHFVGASDPEQFRGMTVEEGFRDIDTDRLSVEHHIEVSEFAALVHRAFAGHPVLQLNFCTVVPWVIDAPEPG